MTESKYTCSCENTKFEIHIGFIRCCKCKREYRVCGFASPDRFNYQREYIIKIPKALLGDNK